VWKEDLLAFPSIAPFGIFVKPGLVKQVLKHTCFISFKKAVSFPLREKLGVLNYICHHLYFFIFMLSCPLDGTSPSIGQEYNLQFRQPSAGSAGTGTNFRAR
jgi:hypothetical protein